MSRYTKQIRRQKAMIEDRDKRIGMLESHRRKMDDTLRGQRLELESLRMLLERLACVNLDFTKGDFVRVTMKVSKSELDCPVHGERLCEYVVKDMARQLRASINRMPLP
jgi:hypothetical protein